jgi:hypothetical protein
MESRQIEGGGHSMGKKAIERKKKSFYVIIKEDQKVKKNQKNVNGN